MSRKDAYLAALKELPDGVQEFLDTTIPSMEDGIWPIEDVDTAILMQGILAWNLNVILHAFEGLRPLEVLLRIGQFNPSIMGLYLSAVEVLNAEAELHTMQAIAPAEGVTLAPGDYTFQAQITGGLQDVASVEVMIEELYAVYAPVNASLEPNQEDGALFETTLDLAIGAYTATFTATFDPTYTVSESINFVVSVI